MERLESEAAAAEDQGGKLRPAATPGVKGARHARLREATRPEHDALDRFTIQAGFFDSANAFTTYLQRLAHFHAAYQSAGDGCDTQGWRQMWTIDRHPQWIAQELSSLNVHAGNYASPFANSFNLTGPAALLGSLYVLAGSTLGARMLHKLTVERALPKAGGSSYLAAVSQSLRWPDFLAFLDTASIGDGEQKMIDGAVATFRAVHLSLEARL